MLSRSAISAACAARPPFASPSGTSILRLAASSGLTPSAAFSRRRRFLEDAAADRPRSAAGHGLGAIAVALTAPYTLEGRAAGAEAQHAPTRRAGWEHANTPMLSL